jgi:hypothetical protein
VNAREQLLSAAPTRMLRVEPSSPVDRAPHAPSITVNPAGDADAPLADLDVAFAITHALDRCGLTSKEAAYAMEIDAAQWSRQLNSREGHVSLQRLRKMPRAFWIELVLILATPLGLSVAHQDMTHVALVKVMELAGEVARLASVQQTLRRSA